MGFRWSFQRRALLLRMGLQLPALVVKEITDYLLPFHPRLYIDVKALEESWANLRRLSGRVWIFDHWGIPTEAELELLFKYLSAIDFDRHPHGPWTTCSCMVYRRSARLDIREPHLKGCREWKRLGYVERTVDYRLPSRKRIRARSAALIDTQK